jgi:hypothetical protein
LIGVLIQPGVFASDRIKQKELVSRNVAKRLLLTVKIQLYVLKNRIWRIFRRRRRA